MEELGLRLATGEADWLPLEQGLGAVLGEAFAEPLKRGEAVPVVQAEALLEAASPVALAHAESVAA